MDRKTRLGINSLFNALGQFWMMGLNFLLIPFIIQGLGKELFGYWVLINVISGYYLLVDLGIGVSFVRFFAEYNSKGGAEGFNRILNTGFSFSLIVSLILGLLILISPQIMAIFTVPQRFYNEVIISFCLCIAARILSNQFGAFQAVIPGLQRYDITNKILLGLSIPYAVATILILHVGMGIIGITVVYGLWVICQAALGIIYAYKLKSDLTFSPFQFHLPTFKALFRYGIRVKVNNLSDIINFQLDHLLLGGLIGPIQVGVYEIGAKVTRFVRSLSLWLLPAVVPASSDLAAVKDYKRINTLYEKGCKYLFALAIPAATFTIATSELLIYIWLGDGYSKSAAIISVLLIGYTANVMTGIGSMIMRGMGEPQYEMRSKVVTIILNVFLSFLLILKYGIWGAVAGTTIAMITGSSYFFHLYHLRMDVPFLTLLKRTLLKPFLASVPGVVLVVFLRWLLPCDSRLGASTVLILDIFLFGALYFISLLGLRFLDTEEKAFAREFIRQVFNKALFWPPYRVVK